MSKTDEITRLIREHVKVDASGLAPAVVEHYLIGFEDAARAIAAMFEAERDAARAQAAGLAEALGDLSSLYSGFHAQEADPTAMAVLRYRAWGQAADALAAYDAQKETGDG